MAPSPTIGPWCRPRARRLQLGEDLRQQLATGTGGNALGVSWKPRLALLDALLLGHLAQVVLDLLLQGVELLEVARLGELRQLLHVDDADLGGLHRLFELLEQLVDHLQLLP